MLLAAMLAMVLAAAVPALAQSVTQVGEDNVACVQTAVQQNIVSQGNGNAQANQNGDNVIANANLNFQSISQECNIAVEQVTEVVHKDLEVVHKAGKVEVVAADVQYKATASATATATATASASSAPAAVQYQYAAPTASATASATAAAELPPTGGSSLIALGAGVLLVAGGLLARRIVR